MAVPYSFFEVYLAVHPKDLPSGRPQVRDRHLKFHEDRDNLAPLLCRIADIDNVFKLLMSNGANVLHR
jgi:hypothetical protein